MMRNGTVTGAFLGDARQRQGRFPGTAANGNGYAHVSEFEVMAQLEDGDESCEVEDERVYDAGAVFRTARGRSVRVGNGSVKGEKRSLSSMSQTVPTTPQMGAQRAPLVWGDL